MDSIPKRQENGIPQFTEDNLQRITINPFYAIAVAPQLTKDHEPPMGEAEWVRAYASLMREMGSERWLRQLLDALNGDIVTAEEVGFAPSVGTFGYGAPGTSNAQRQGKKKRRKRHHKSDFSVAAVPRCLGTQNDSAVRPGRTNTEGTRGEHAYHIFPAWYRKSDQEE